MVLGQEIVMVVLISLEEREREVEVKGGKQLCSTHAHPLDTITPPDNGNIKADFLQLVGI